MKPGSVLGPLLFNIFINDLFLIEMESEICNFADDTTIYACDTSIEAVMIRSEGDVLRLLKWFTDNGMTANPSKCQIMFLGRKDMSKLCLSITGNLIPSSNQVKLLGVNIDNSLSCEAHVKELCRKVNLKVNAFIRLRLFLGEQKSKLIFNSVIMSNFSYCPLIWLFCTKGAINRTHKRALRALYGDYGSTFEELLDRDKSKTIHKKNLHILMTEVYRTINHLNPEYMWEFFTKRDVPYGLRSSELCMIPSVNYQRYGINSLSFRGSLLWNALSDEIKLTTSTKNFKKEIRHWDGKSRTCHICT